MIIGIDLGGTNIKGANVNITEGIVKLYNNLTPASEGKEAVLNAIFTVIDRLRSESNDAVYGIGIGTPGIIDSEGTIIGASPNIKGWKGTPLGKILKEKYKVPVVVENDVTSVTMGEVIFGSAKCSDNVSCIAIGTGIGIGLIINGKPFKKAHEMGHTIVKFDGAKCGCGRNGCLEAYVSARGLENRYKELTNTEVTPKEIFEKYRKGEAKSIIVINDFIYALSSIIVNNLLSFSTTNYIISGGVAKSFEIFIDQLKEEVSQRSISHLNKQIEITKGTLGDNAGILGAASLVNYELGNCV